ncbi:uncharacterized protein LOC125038469 [Penaeus chinensis]|uniref:uncharacterized protein LOC125038469 n=1 Tax=Penaeus chinensis TaxID=139456 RepID=UPI001FB6C2F9|nr:uncharacterized protein LOC125038469 [Penaeus chinensis]
MAVSLTTLLVLYTLYGNASEALPATAYVKMIDVWFFFCIFLLFFVIVVHVIAEHLVNMAGVTLDYPLSVRRNKMSARPSSPVADRIIIMARTYLIPMVIILFNCIYWGIIFGTE